MEPLSVVDDQRLCADLHQLIPALSTTLVRADIDELDPAIDLALERVANTIGIECAAFVEYDDDGGVMRTHGWATDDRASALPDAPWGLHADREVLVDDMPDDHAHRTGLRSAAIIRVTLGGGPGSVLALATPSESCAWPPSLIEPLRLFAEILAGAVHRQRIDQALRDSERDVLGQHAPAERETEPFNDSDAPDVDGIIGRSPALRAALARLREVAPTNSSVLLLGETGTGKELFARAIHHTGPRRAHPLVVVNCAALPPSLIESELFGHARGAFTGAITTRQGRFEMAHRGTLFLDEIGDLPLDLQTKLLRVLQEGTFERVGSSQTQKVDVRIIAATHRDLRDAIAKNEFREDLYYRLSVFPIQIPALRDRRTDIRELVWFIIHKRQRAMQRSITRVPDSVMQALQQYEWPGNVRELENVLERALIHSTGDTLKLLDDHVILSAPRPESDGTLCSVERSHISEVLNACGGRINGTGNAAERLGMHPNTLRFRMKKLGIVRKNGRGDAAMNEAAAGSKGTAFTSY
jgi:transcriptional regulator with GAF, ATPase, and Fis domain